MASEQVREDDEFQRLDDNLELDELDDDELDDYDESAALDDEDAEPVEDDAEPADEDDAEPADEDDVDDVDETDEDAEPAGEADVADDEEAADEDEEDEEESLEALLTRGRDIDDSEVDSESRQGLTPVTPLVGAGEFTCRSCFLVKRRAQLADEERLICRDCM